VLLNQPGLRAARRLLAGLSITETVSWGAYYYAFAVFVAPMETELGWSRSATSAAFSIGLTSWAAAAPWAGRAVDGGRVRLLMTGGSCLGALMLVCWSRIESLGGLYAVWAGLGVAMAATLYDPALATVARRFGSAAPRALATLTLVGASASSIFLPLAAWLQQQMGWRGALVALALVAAGITIPIHALVLSAPAARTAMQAARFSDGTVGGARPAPLGASGLHGFGLAFGLAGLVSGAVSVHLVGSLVERGASAPASAAIAGSLGAMQIPGRLLYPAAAARLGARRLAAGVLGLQALGLSSLAADVGGASLAGFVVCYGLGNGLATLARASVLTDCVVPEAYGRASGTLAACATIGRAAGPLLVGWLLDTTARHEVVLGLLVAALLSGSLAARPFDQKPSVSVRIERE